MDFNLAFKILNAEQIRLTDQFTIKNEPITSIDLMERAAEAFVNWFVLKFSTHYPVHIFCGVGNNGGDGLAIARLLKSHHFEVNVYCIGSLEKASRYFKVNYDFNQTCLATSWISDHKEIPTITSNEIVVDAIFGSGLSRPLAGLVKDLVEQINGFHCHAKIGVDIATGLSCNKSLASSKMEVSHTLSFQLPKLSFFFPQNVRYTGEMCMAKIGLDDSFIQSMESSYYLTTKMLVQSLVKKRDQFMHKGQAGRCLLIAGSFGKMGAALLAGRGCLKAGAGLLTIAAPVGGVDIIQVSLPEAMVITQEVEILPAQYNAIGIGPGLGQEIEKEEILYQLITDSQSPLVLDADAINILSCHLDWIQELPEQTILTPHVKEFERLVGKCSDDYDRLEKQRTFCRAHQLVVVLKGAYTSVCSSEGVVCFNSTGNPGMATAGSGDVLTGMITALIGQGYQSFEAAIIGVYLHGLSGDLALTENSHETLIASDVIRFLPNAFQAIHNS